MLTHPHLLEQHEMHDHDLSGLVQTIHEHANELSDFFTDLDEDLLPRALRQHFRRALIQLNHELASLIEDTGAAGSKLARHEAQASPVPRPYHRCAKA
jgi:hypothetical protein